MEVGRPPLHIKNPQGSEGMYIIAKSMYNEVWRLDCNPQIYIIYNFRYAQVCFITYRLTNIFTTMVSIKIMLSPIQYENIIRFKVGQN